MAPKQLSESDESAGPSRQKAPQEPLKFLVRRKKLKATKKVRTQDSDADDEADNVSAPDIFLVTAEEMHKLIRTKDVPGYLVQWRDLNDEGSI